MTDFKKVTDTVSVSPQIGKADIDAAAEAGFSLISFKLLLILAFMWMTSPVASHALAQASLYAGRKPQLKANHVSKQSADAFALPAVEAGNEEEK